ncbi:unnamed protein product [Peronospora destructor]|uniref:Uncharacterized protein n=1 Tax=Peronospora destructor TaxID=86335 RepID=A0AAV0SWF8_9STRA|nr:unnamed protein product [Peronospora destructor]
MDGGSWFSRDKMTTGMSFVQTGYATSYALCHTSDCKALTATDQLAGLEDSAYTSPAHFLRILSCVHPPRPISVMRSSTEPVNREPPGRPAKPPDPGEGKKHTQDRADPKNGHERVAETPPMSEGVEAAQLKHTAMTSEAPVIKGESTSGVEDQPGVPGEEGEEREVRSKEMFEAVVEAIKTSPLDPPHEAWIAAVAELYAIAHDTVTIAAELVPTGKQRFPTLRSDEKALLFKFFEEACIVSEGLFVKWEHGLQQNGYRHAAHAQPATGSS